MTLPADPLFFHPRLEEKIWGGTRLRTLLGKELPRNAAVGESWELSAVANNETVVASGSLSGRSLGSIYSEFPYELAGAFASRHPVFPLLVKFIDANDRLSVQVHPDDRLAHERFGAPFGKTECWYIVDAGKNGMLGLGCKRALTKKELREAAASGEIEQLLNTVRAKSGEVYFIPAGTIHAILGDMVIYEVQQSSDTTFRLYDWKRTGASEKGRPLHIDEAVEAADLTFRQNFRIAPLEINFPDYRRCFRVACKYFALEEYIAAAAAVIDLPPKRSFRIITVLSGRAGLAWAGGNITVPAGSTILIPAALENCSFCGENGLRFLLTSVPDLEHEIEAPLRNAGFSPREIALLGGEGR